MTICSNCVLDDESVEDIVFGENGICNYCKGFHETTIKNWYPNDIGKKLLSEKIDKIKEEGKNKEYDCIIGLSGGIDSSYMTYKAKDWGLRPLVVHVDAGWNSELAVSNIEKIINYTGFDLHTEVIDWEEVRRLQIAYLKSGISNQDVPQDHIFFSTLYHYSIKHKINYSISGGNIATESILPNVWHGSAMDAINLKDIFKKYGSGRLNNYKTISFFQYRILYPLFYRLETIRPLDYMVYDKKTALLDLEKIGYKKYNGKHGESVFTKFFQEYYLPKKFNIDKRKAHLSSLILSKQISRDEAIEILNKPSYDIESEDQTIDYICKKLEISRVELDGFMKVENRSYKDYKNWDQKKELLSLAHRIFKKITRKSITISH
jgi:aminotransferase